MMPPTNDDSAATTEDIPSRSRVPRPADIDPLADESTEGNDEAEACSYTTYREGAEATHSADERATPSEPPSDATGRETRVWGALAEVEDPEMPISVVDLGLIYDVTVEAGHATVEMTLTYTGCPARDSLTDDVERAAAGVAGVDSTSVDLVWSPEWTLEMVTEQGRATLREFGVSI